MHSSTRRSGGGANVYVARRCGVMSPRRSKQKLTNVHGPASDIAAYEVRIHALKVGGREHTPRQDAVAEAGSETLNLVFQFLQHVYSGSVRHMAVSPGRVLARRRA